jgi:methionine-rich copper-binding protein CopC
VKPLACIVGAVLALVAQAALAHAFLDHAEPRVGSTVKASPTEVKLWFTQDLEPAFSTLRVVDKDGKEIDRKDKKVDGSTMRVSLPPLAPGKYRVQWRALSVDTHVTDGDFTFIVSP